MMQQSFTRHADVQAYLESYARAFDLLPFMTFGATVTSVRPLLRAGRVIQDSEDFTELAAANSMYSDVENCDWEVTYTGQVSSPCHPIFCCRRSLTGGAAVRRTRSQ